MRITFERTGDRRYRVTAHRGQAPDLVMEPAPGFDAHLPHDLVHFLVERHWRLREGIYGDLAAGGDAGTFRPLDAPRDRRWVKKHAGLATAGADMDRSEALAAARDWRAATPRGSLTLDWPWPEGKVGRARGT